jgi:predicted nucleic acid-binding protein
MTCDAARIYYDCRRRGLTVRSTLDCVVAQIAIEHGVPLLHDDRDYTAISRVRSLSARSQSRSCQPRS